jgi:hypothetical protein
MHTYTMCTYVCTHTHTCTIQLKSTFWFLALRSTRAGKCSTSKTLNYITAVESQFTIEAFLSDKPSTYFVFLPYGFYFAWLLAWVDVHLLSPSSSDSSESDFRKLSIVGCGAACREWMAGPHIGDVGVRFPSLHTAELSRTIEVCGIVRKHGTGRL